MRHRLKPIVGGVDPGANGGIALAGIEAVGEPPFNRFTRELVDTVALRDMRASGRNEAQTPKGLSYAAFVQYFSGINMAYDLRLVCIERQHVRDTDGAVSAAAIVAEYNGMVAALTALGIRVAVVLPQSMYGSTSFERRTVTKRARALNRRYRSLPENKAFSVAVSERFLGIDFGNGKPNDGVADAGCYALHAAKVVNSNG